MVEKEEKWAGEKLQIQLELEQKVAVSSAAVQPSSDAGAHVLHLWRKKIQEKDREIRQLKQQLRGKSNK